MDKLIKVSSSFNTHYTFLIENLFIFLQVLVKKLQIKNLAYLN